MPPQLLRALLARRYVISVGGFEALLRRSAEQHVRGIVVEAEKRRRQRGGVLEVIGARTAGAVARAVSVSCSSTTSKKMTEMEVSFEPLVSGSVTVFTVVPRECLSAGRLVAKVDPGAPWFSYGGRSTTTAFSGGSLQTLSVECERGLGEDTFGALVLITPDNDNDRGGDEISRPISPIVIGLTQTANVVQFAVVDGTLRQLERVFGDGSGRREAGDSSDDPVQCLVCWDNQPLLVLLPCRHRCVCSGCLPQLERKCPLCRNQITTAMGVAES
eukprot:m.142599 g.142599  ORF g.142599 m.142599 type:complete len:273 (+) comp14074_c0_seq7:301-1119(+)